MIDIPKWLKEGDPMAREPDLSFADIQRMRHVVLAEATAPRTTWWPRPVLVATTVAFTLAAGVALGRRLPAPSSDSVSPGRATRQVNDPASPATAHRRQLQFSTRGGTRIIWIFNSDFTL